MSYCTLEEAFQSNISDSVLPPMRQNLEEPSSRGERGRSKSKKQRRSNLPPQEPTVVEPDRPAHRPKHAAELLGGGAPGNDTSTSLSSYLIGSPDPNEDYFPFPSGDTNEHDPSFEKQFMLEPNWYEQFQHRMPNPKSETPQLPGASVDGYNTLYSKVPAPEERNDTSRNVVTEQDRPGDPVSTMGSVSQDSELKKRIDELFEKIDNLELSRSESNHSEIILFVMTGIFVLLMLDLLLKQGSRAIGHIATAVALPRSARIGIAGGGGYGYNNPFFF